MSDEDIIGDLVVPLVAVLRELHHRPGLEEIVEQACEERGVEIDWDGARKDSDA